MEPTSDPAAARKAPGIALFVVGILNELMAGFSIVMGALGGSFGGPQEEVPPGFEQFAALGPMVQIGVGVLAMILGVLMILGGYHLQRGTKRGLALAGAIAALIPTTACCCLALPIGVWALIVINKAEVKSSFTS